MNLCHPELLNCELLCLIWFCYLPLNINSNNQNEKKTFVENNYIKIISKKKLRKSHNLYIIKLKM